METASATPGKKPVWKRWWFWLAVILVVAAIGSTSDGDVGSTGRSAGKSTSSRPASSRTEAPSGPAAQEPAAPATDKKTESDARVYAGTVTATLDVTTSEQLLLQMPDDIQPEMSRDGEERKFTWTFADGSQMIAVFRPAGGEGSGQGLVLYSVDIRD